MRVCVQRCNRTPNTHSNERRPGWKVLILANFWLLSLSLSRRRRALHSKAKNLENKITLMYVDAFNFRYLFMALEQCLQRWDSSAATECRELFYHPATASNLKVWKFWIVVCDRMPCWPKPGSTLPDPLSLSFSLSLVATANPMTKRLFVSGKCVCLPHTVRLFTLTYTLT